MRRLGGTVGFDGSLLVPPPPRLPPTSTHPLYEPVTVEGRQRFESWHPFVCVVIIVAYCVRLSFDRNACLSHTVRV